MKALILTQCTSKHALTHPRQLTSEDLDQDDWYIDQRMKSLPTIEAERMYLGVNFRRTLHGAICMREGGHKAELGIVSCPGYGFVSGDTLIAPYDYGREGWSLAGVQQWALTHQVPHHVSRKLHSESWDFVLVLLTYPTWIAAGLESELQQDIPAPLVIVSASNHFSAALRRCLPQDRWCMAGEVIGERLERRIAAGCLIEDLLTNCSRLSQTVMALGGRWAVVEWLETWLLNHECWRSL